MPGKTNGYEGESVFRLSESQLARLKRWMLEIDTKLATNQSETGKLFYGKNKLSPRIIRLIRESIERGEPAPYYGASGGAYEYSFVPTSIGTVIKVKNVVSGDIIDLSEYEDW